jgi:GH15 family glucan-1,4-alpha-glucosidase
VTATDAKTTAREQSAADTGPFPFIEEYAFLSDCHTGALVAPDGSVDWLCIPSFDSPSVFASLLDRQAGSFRLGPFGVSVPAARVYDPGTNTLVTGWQTPSGWVLVRDALTIGPRRGDDPVTRHTRPPADDDAEHMLVRTVECIDGTVEVELVCEPAFEYGSTKAEWKQTDGTRLVADATGGGLTIRLASDIAFGIEGDRVRGRHVLRQGERAYCALSWSEDLAIPRDFAEAQRQLETTSAFWRAWIARARIPDHRWRAAIQRSASQRGNESHGQYRCKQDLSSDSHWTILLESVISDSTTGSRVAVLQ